MTTTDAVAITPPLITRIYAIVVDVTLLMFLAAWPFVVLVTFAAPGWEVLTGIWAAVTGLSAAPALVLLYVSRPRERWVQRSALVASGVGFARAVWAGAVFALSIILGAVTGIVASRVSDEKESLGDAVGAAIDAVAGPFLGQTLLVVAGVAYAWMGVWWLIDLTAFRREGAALALCAQVERRWLAPSAYLRPDTRDRLVSALFHLGRMGLFFSMLTVGWTLIANLWAAIQS